MNLKGKTEFLGLRKPQNDSYDGLQGYSHHQGERREDEFIWLFAVFTCSKLQCFTNIFWDELVKYLENPSKQTKKDNESIPGKTVIWKENVTVQNIWGSPVNNICIITVIAFSKQSRPKIVFRGQSSENVGGMGKSK